MVVRELSNKQHFSMVSTPGPWVDSMNNGLLSGSVSLNKSTPPLSCFWSVLL